MEKRQGKLGELLIDITQKNGTGIFVSIVGLKYQGEWKDGAKIGKGVSTYKDESGKVINDLYTNGRSDADEAHLRCIVADLPDSLILS